jgi:isocitrate/isopropylmalate dehydrogenase
MMRDFFGLSEAAAEVERAVAGVLAEGETLPADPGGSASTDHVAEAVLERLD